MNPLKKNLQHYRPHTWSNNYVNANKQGDVVMCLNQGEVSLPVVAKQLQEVGFKLPAVVRFPELITRQAESVNHSFEKAIKKYKYNNKYTGIYPLKVNPMACVTKTFLQSTNYGFEAGSKTELLEAMSLALPKKRTVLVNGHKDDVMFQAILEGSKCGHRVIPILEKRQEFDSLLEMADKLDVTPCFGVRVRLYSRGSGRWRTSAGERAKFGLNQRQLPQLPQPQTGADLG